MIQNLTFIIKHPAELDKDLKDIDKQINDDAFHDLLDIDEQTKKQLKEKYHVKPWTYIFAKQNERFIGRVMLDKRNLSFENFHFVAVGINGLGILREYQKQGIGRGLMQEVIRFCKSSNIGLIFLDAGEDLQNYYKSLGFIGNKYQYRGLSGKVYLEADGMVLFLNRNTEAKLKGKLFNVENGNVKAD